MAAGRRDPGAGGGLPGSSGGLAGRAVRHKTDGRTLLCRRPLQSETLPEGPSSHTKENATPETKTSRRRTLSHLGLSVGHSSAKTREPQGTTLRSGGGGAGAARVTISCMRGEGTGHRLGPVRARGVRQRPARGPRVRAPGAPPVAAGSERLLRKRRRGEVRFRRVSVLRERLSELTDRPAAAPGSTCR